MSRARPRGEECPYAGRGGLKLRFALDHFRIDVAGLTAADLGSHIGGFVDCLLQAGAVKVYSVDTARGVLAWRLRQDERVVVHERTNALHWEAPEPVSLVTIDVGWTPQRLILPVALRMLRSGGAILSLVKPQYEVPRQELRRGVLPAERAPAALENSRRGIPPDLEFGGQVESPYRGSGGNVEYWWLLKKCGGGA